MKFIYSYQLLLIIICAIATSCKNIKNNKETSHTTIEMLNNTDSIKSSAIISKDKNIDWDQCQDSLRKILLKSQTNTQLKSSLLSELYIRGLVNQEKDQIQFQLPFDLHAFDCGSPDCYTTNISFEIETTSPIIFPKEISFNIQESGCTIDTFTIKK